MVVGVTGGVGRHGVILSSTGNREQGTGNREQGTGNREQGTGNREQEIGSSCGSVQTAGLSTSLRFGRDDKFVGEAGRNMVFRVELL